TNRYALAVLAAHPDSGIEFEIVPNGRDMLERLRTVATQSRAFDRRGHFSVFDQVSLRSAERKLAAGDVDLAAAELHGVQSTFDRPYYVFLCVRALEHKSVCHSRQRHVPVTLPSSISRARRVHEPGVQKVTYISPQHAVLDQHRTARRLAFIIDVNRAATIWNRTVINHGAQLRSYALSDQATKGRCLFPIEIRFKPMTHGFVKQDSRPTRTEHNLHRSRRCCNRLQLNDRLSSGFARELVGRHFALEEFNSDAPSAPGTSNLEIAVIVRDTGYAKPRKGLNVSREPPVGRRDHHVLHLVIDG